MVCFCTLKGHVIDENAIALSLRNQVREHIGAFATPKLIIVTSDLPKTRSGKIMRRILRKCAGGEVSVADLESPKALSEKLGDLSTLAEPSIIEVLVRKCA